MCIRDRNNGRVQPQIPGNTRRHTTKHLIVSGPSQFLGHETLLTVASDTTSTPQPSALSIHRTAYQSSITPCHTCLLYTSDAADDLTRVDLGGRRILKN